MNKVFIAGHLGADPELKFTQGGQAVLKLRVATKDSYKDKAGEWQETTEWHTVVMWGRRAEAVNKILSKGSAVTIEGKLQTRSWEAKEGGKRYATEINASDIFVGSKGGGGPRNQSAGNSYFRDEGGAGEYDTTDIPF
jgi:single-strand DNA-binding protein